MMGILLVLGLFSGLFVADNQEFFEQVEKDIEAGAEWHYVGKQPLDPTAKSIPAQICDDNGCGEPYIIWKLKKPE